MGQDSSPAAGLQTRLRALGTSPALAINTTTTSYTPASATGATSYDVYFGTASPPPLATNTTATSFVAPKQSSGATCYWKIVAKNTAGANGSAVWSFSTALAAPVLASPATGATGVALTPALNWGAVAAATSYDVYFGTASSPPLATNATATSYSPSVALTAGTVYYWQVAAKNSGGSTSSAVRSFTTH